MKSTWVALLVVFAVLLQLGEAALKTATVYFDSDSDSYYVKGVFHSVSS